jgi:hypothetical protein
MKTETLPTTLNNFAALLRRFTPCTGGQIEQEKETAEYLAEVFGFTAEEMEKALKFYFGAKWTNRADFFCNKRHSAIEVDIRGCLNTAMLQAVRGICVL